MVFVYIGVAVLAVILVVLVFAMLYRVIVSTNEVHIIQRNESTTVYGGGAKDGTKTNNVYYNIPSWIPIFGISRIVLPISHFSIDLNNYETFDKDKVPFVVDVNGFFRISNPAQAAQRIENFEALRVQLTQIVDGAMRTVFAKKTVIEIMEARSEISEMFNEEVVTQLANWGVENVKSVEITDIRDSSESTVIKMIKDTKSSAIERDSRVEIAENLKLAEIKEIETKKEADMIRENALREVGEKEADRKRLVGVANEKASQDIASQAKTTKEKDMEVIKVETIKQAEITKEQTLITAAMEKEKMSIDAEALKIEQERKAEADLITATKLAEGKLVEMTKNAEGIAAEGKANAEATASMERAKVEGQIALVDKIKENVDYMSYLQNIEAIKANESIGTSQAEAMKSAEIKIVANTGANLSEGMNNVTDLFTAKGGAAITGLLENLKNTDSGSALVDRLVGTKKEEKKEPALTATEVIEEMEDKNDKKKSK